MGEKMIFIKVDWKRGRLYFVTASCKDFIKTQVKVLIKSEDENFTRHRLFLKDVSYGNFKTFEIREMNALEEIGVPLPETKKIDVDFLVHKLREKENTYRDLLRAGNAHDGREREYILQRSLPTEKITAKIITAMNDFSLFKEFVRSMRFHPGVRRSELGRIWNETNECFSKLLVAEYRSLDPFLIRRETRRFCDIRRLPFDSYFYQTRFLPSQKSFLKKKFRQTELEECQLRWFF